jgi:signal peptidase I
VFLLAVLIVPALGHVLRRLNDMAWSGWWAWGLALPWIRWVVLLTLPMMPSSQRRRRTNSGWRHLGLGMAGAAALVLLGSLLWTTVGIGGQDMKPTLLPGDMVLVRLAPVDLIPGEVVAFRLPGEESVRVGRIIGMSDDRVAIEGGAPVVNGRRAAQAQSGYFTETFGRQGPRGVMPLCGNGTVGLGAECRTRQMLETLPDGAAYPVLDTGQRPLDAAGEVTVPDGFLYILGDHRDAAQDSRLARAVRGTGLVAEEQVIGRVDLVLASSEARRFWDLRGWRWDRLLESVR